jgi:hypothetical protein
MQRVSTIVAFLLISNSPLLVHAKQSTPPQQPPTQTLTLPSGTPISFLFLRAVFARTAKPGDPLYMQTTYPVTIGPDVAIPAGTFLQGTLQALTKPTRKSSHAFLTVSLEKLIFPNGYSVLLYETSKLDVQVSAASDLFLDNGTQAEIKLTLPLQLNAQRVQASLALARPIKPGSLLPATRCMPTAGTPGSPGLPGSPDIVIPGNPGTPDTVIPNADGTSTTIPGIPATPPTVIPGSPGTPDDPGTPATSCPAPPLVLSSASSAP